MSSGGSGGGGSQTVTQQQQIPQYEQQFSQQNQQLARSLGGNPYPIYGGQLIQGFTPQQTQAFQDVGTAANEWMPYMGGAVNATNAGLTMNAAAPAMGQLNSNYGGWALGQGANMAAGGATPAYDTSMINSGMANMALNPANAATVQSFMNPYVQSSLNPQLLALRTQLAQQQQGINSQATQAGAFGDARQGAQAALQNYYGNQATSGVEAQGFNTAFNAAQNQIAQQQQLGANQFGQGQAGALAQLQFGQGLMGQGFGAISGQQEAMMQAAGQEAGFGNQLAQMGGTAQQLGLQGAQAEYGAGQLQQQLQQQQLDTAYQQYLNQTMWPYQMLSMRESALSNQPYQMQTATQLPQANMVAQGLGAFAGLGGSLGSLFGGGQAAAPFGGAAFNGAQANVR
jgi:hypothetical protein